MDFFTPDLRSGSPFKGAPATLGEIYDVTADGQRKIENFNSLFTNLETEIDDRIDRIAKGGGPQLRNPMRDATTVEDRRQMMSRIDAGNTDVQWGHFQRLQRFESELADLEKSKPELAEVEARIRGINPYAKLHRTERCKVALADVLERGAFDLDRILEIEPAFLEADDHDHHHQRHRH